MMVQMVPMPSVQSSGDVTNRGSPSDQSCHRPIPSRPQERCPYFNQARSLETAPGPRAASGPETELRHEAAEIFVQSAALSEIDLIGPALKDDKSKSSALRRPKQPGFDQRPARRRDGLIGHGNIR